MRHALLGGTFDPIHLGHIHAAQELARICKLERITLLPSALPPHKQDKHITSFAHRLAMVKRAIKSNPLFEVDDFEYHQKGPSYSIDTLRHYRRTHPQDQLFFIMGSDMASIFASWKSWRSVLEIVELLIVQRPGENVQADPDLPLAVQKKLKSCYQKINTLPFSSTLVRTAITQAKNADAINHMVAPEVMQYIKEQNLYVQNMPSF